MSLSRFRRLKFPIFLFLTFFLFSFQQVWADEYQLTIYFAAGGVCGGIYWFISYTSGWLDGEEPRPALLTYGPRGWQAGGPAVHVFPYGPAAGAPYIELLRVQF